MTLNQIGLILNIIGTIMICIYGLPNNYDDESGSQYLTYGTNKEYANGAKKKNRRRKKLAWASILVLFIGFIFQFIDTLLVKNV
jgi:hypothetical protein